jgi:hypothetical protein
MCGDKKNTMASVGDVLGFFDGDWKSGIDDVDYYLVTKVDACNNIKLEELEEVGQVGETCQFKRTGITEWARPNREWRYKIGHRCNRDVMYMKHELKSYEYEIVDEDE